LARWSAQEKRITVRKASADEKATLWTEAEFGDAKFVLDCRPAKPAADKEPVTPSVHVRGRGGQGVEVKLESSVPGAYQRFVISVKGGDVRVMCDGRETHRVKLPADGPKRGAFGLGGAGGTLEFMNVYARDL
jgi:hypothetical protein